MAIEVYMQKLFSIIIKNLNWEILTMNLVTFKRWDGVKDEKFWYYGGSLKNPIFRGGTRKIKIWGGGCLAKKEGWYFWGGGGVDTPMHSMVSGAQCCSVVWLDNQCLQGMQKF